MMKWREKKENGNLDLVSIRIGGGVIGLLGN